VTSSFGSFILLFLFLTVRAVSAGNAYDDNGLSGAVGFEYQLITQEYQDAIYDTISVDPIEYRKTSDEIDDLFLKTNLSYRFRDPKNLFNLKTDMELSADRLIGRAESSYRLGNYNNNLMLAGLFENKTRYGNDEEYDEGYNSIEGYIKSNHTLSSRLRLMLKAGAETVIFNNNGQVVSEDSITQSLYSSFDYTLITVTASNELSLNGFSDQLYWNIGYIRRYVPDSTEADYGHVRLNLEFTSFWTDGYISLFSELDFKDYNRSDKTDDYSALNLNGRLNQKLNNELTLGVGSFLDVYSFTLQDIVNRNYALFRGDVRLTRAIGASALGPIIKMEFRREEELEDLPENYSEFAGGIVFESLSGRDLFMDAEVLGGRRSYRDDYTILSSYTYFSSSLIASYRFWRQTSLNVLFDGTFEFHDLSENDTNLYLVSIGLTSRF